MPHSMMILYLHLPGFHVSNSTLFFTKYFSTLILHGRSLHTFHCRLVSRVGYKADKDGNGVCWDGGKVATTEDMSARSRYQVQGLVITSHM